MSEVRQFFLTLPNCPVTTGDISPMPINTLNRFGYLFCDGSAISRSDYSLLFGVIGTLYGNGNGSTTFNIPDLRNYFIRGWGGNSRALGLAQSDSYQSHTHNFRRGRTGTYDSSQVDGSWENTLYNSDYITGANTGSETRPVNISVRWGIRYI